MKNKKNNTVSKTLQAAIETTFKDAQRSFKKQKGFQTTLLVDFKSTVIPETEQPKGRCGFTITLADEASVNARRYIARAVGVASSLLDYMGLYSDPIYIQIASEMWVSESGSVPAEDPQRKELLMVVGSDRTSTVLKAREIVRTALSASLVKTKTTKMLEESDMDPHNPILCEYWDALDISSRNLQDNVGITPEMKQELSTLKEKDPKAAVDQIISFVLNVAKEVSKN